LERRESVRVGSRLVEGVGGIGVLGSSSPEGDGSTLDLSGWDTVSRATWASSCAPESSASCPSSTSYPFSAGRVGAGGELGTTSDSAGELDCWADSAGSMSVVAMRGGPREVTASMSSRKSEAAPQQPVRPKLWRRARLILFCSLSHVHFSFRPARRVCRGLEAI
jgi:hypothetical protein